MGDQATQVGPLCRPEWLTSLGPDAAKRSSSHTSLTSLSSASPEQAGTDNSLPHHISQHLGEKNALPFIDLKSSFLEAMPIGPPFVASQNNLSSVKGESPTHRVFSQ